jgi:hypothetical protein
MLEQPRSIMTKAIDGIERAAKLIAALIALIAAAAFFIPPIGTAVAMLTAWRFGVVGYAYYEIGQQRELTSDGNFHLLKGGSGLFETIAIGDKLQVRSGGTVNIRDMPIGDPQSKTLILFKVREGDCVIVFGKGSKVETRNAVSGGWLRVGTTACGLFR